MINSTPTISVLMPVYNTEKYLREAIESILNQTFADFEFLIFDDASTDGSVAIIQSYTDARINLTIKPINSGYTSSLNMGLAAAKGKYIVRMDSDDISDVTRFEKQLNFMEANPEVAICGSWFKFINSNTVIKHPQWHDEIKVSLLDHCVIGHPTVMMHSQFLKDHKLAYNPEMEPAEDYDLWTKIAIKGKLHNLQETLLHYRIHEGQVSTTRALKQNNISNQIRLKLLNKLFVDKPLLSLPFELVKDLPNRALIFNIINNNLSILGQIEEENGRRQFFSPQLLHGFLQTQKSKITAQFFYDRRAINFKNLWLLLQNGNQFIKRTKRIRLLKYVVKSLLKF